jgi:hypothetical protein
MGCTPCAGSGRENGEIGLNLMVLQMIRFLAVNLLRCLLVSLPTVRFLGFWV